MQVESSRDEHGHMINMQYFTGLEFSWASIRTVVYKLFSPYGMATVFREVQQGINYSMLPL